MPKTYQDGITTNPVQDVFKINLPVSAVNIYTITGKYVKGFTGNFEKTPQL